VFVLPLEVENPTRGKQYVLWAIIVANVIVFVVSILHGADLSKTWGYRPAHPTMSTVLTSMFLHGGYLHILGNMFFLWMFGDNIEDVIGPYFFGLSYLGCGIAATFFYTALNAESTIPLIGASGAISGVVGMYVAFFPRASADLVVYLYRWQLRKVRTTIFVAVGIWFAEQVALAALLDTTGLNQYIRIAFSAHIGGFLMGVLLGIFFSSLGILDSYIQNGKIWTSSQRRLTSGSSATARLRLAGPEPRR
jgi:membrane associated rhomboid family serine protease